MHDRFHIAKYLGEAVDAVRKPERSLAQAGDSPLTGNKWAWQKTYADGRSAEAVALKPAVRSKKWGSGGMLSESQESAVRQATGQILAQCFSPIPHSPSPNTAASTT